MCRSREQRLPHIGRVLLLAFVVIFIKTSHAADVIRIGGLFDRPDLRQDAAFRSAVEAVNSDRQLLARARLSVQVETVAPGDSFAAAKRACQILRSGVAAILGPQSSHSCAHVQSMCAAKQVPHIQTRAYYPLDWSPYSINLFPHPSTLAKAYSSVLRGLGWSKFTIIYESVEGLVRVQELLKDDLFRISLRQLPTSGDFRPLLKECKKSGSSHVVLDVERLHVTEVLRQAQQVGMMTSYHHYFITSLDLHTMELGEFRHGGSNISALRLIDPGSSLLQQALKDLAVENIAKAEEGQGALGPSWRHLFPSGPDSALTRPEESRDYRDSGDSDVDSDAASYLNVSSLPTEVALVYDAVRLLATAVDDLGRSRPLEFSPLSCDDERVWQHGSALAKYMKWVQLSGLSGLIRFDEAGFRKDVALDVIELTKAGLMKVGRWSGKEGVSFSRIHSSQRNLSPLSNRTLVATTVLAAPYAMLKPSEENLEGNSRFEGFSVDLLREIAKSLGFAFTLRLAKDGQHGKYDPATEKWTGMIGELLEQEADLAIGDLTITYEREQVVDFTMPWMNLGISILYRRVNRRAPNFFSFMAPLSLDVWLYIATAYLAVSLLLHWLARITPYEDKSNDKGSEGPSSVPQFNLGNSLWFIVGSLLQQGTEQHPRAYSTRILATLWWFFTLIMISSYTANLAAFLTVERMVSPIESAEDLAAQTKIKYGSLYGGSTWNFFSTSKVPTYQKMFAFMESQRPSVYTSSNQEGVDRVLRGNGQYAFLMESSSIEYVTERDCRLTQVGGLLDAKGYGIALPSGSPYRALVNDAVLRLQESGKLRDLRRRWWRELSGGGCEPEEPKKSATAASSLDLSSVGGVFAVLGVGMAAAVLVALTELFWRTRAVAVRQQVSFWSEMCRSLRKAFCCPSVGKKLDADQSRSSQSPCDIDFVVPTLDLPQLSEAQSPAACDVSGYCTKMLQQIPPVHHTQSSNFNQHLMQLRQPRDVTYLHQNPPEARLGVDQMTSFENFQQEPTSSHAPHCSQRLASPMDTFTISPTTIGATAISRVQTSTFKDPSPVSHISISKIGNKSSTLPRRNINDIIYSSEMGNLTSVSPKNHSGVTFSSSRTNLLAETSSQAVKSGEPLSRCTDMTDPDLTEKFGVPPPPASILL